MSQMTKDIFKEQLQQSLFEVAGKTINEANNRELYLALGTLLRKEIGRNWALTNQTLDNIKEVYYLSMEFLTGTFTKKNLQYLELYNIAIDTFEKLGKNIEDIFAMEEDPGLGNGGLGRLAVAFLDSLASLKMPGFGYGLRYEKGLFKQEINDKGQLEVPDSWLLNENIWEYKRENEIYEVKLGGNIDISGSGKNLVFTHVNYETIKAIPYDIPILGYKNGVVNYLRLWEAQSYKDIDFKRFSQGSIDLAFEGSNKAKALTQFLYPEDSNPEGKRLRLKQEYFLVSASLQDLIYKYKKQGLDLKEFHKYRAIHINDTHPVLAIPEFMRILVDENGLEWNKAWDISVKTFAFTNHTILSEAMERWNVNLFKETLPRMWMIIEEINYRYIYFLKNTKKILDDDRLRELSIIENNQVKMVNLAVMGSHSTNGVATLHTSILIRKELEKLHKVFPERFNNKTNGIVHRKWLLSANPELCNLITELIGDKFVSNPLELINLTNYINDKEALNKLAVIKHHNKEKLAKIIMETQGIKINPYSIFDIHIKRIHEYKRQLLNIMHIMYLYDLLKNNPNLDIPSRTFIFGGKAAPGYLVAKEIIRLIVTVANVINKDLTIKDKLKVVFIEDYNVSKAEYLIPAANVSEQISTTTKEASGTGNMKFMMNGAIILCTLDGANVEIAREVGEENIMIFGLRDYEVYEYRDKNNYNPRQIYYQDRDIKSTVDKLIDRTPITGYEEFRTLYDLLTKYNDHYFILKDFDEYKKTQQKISEYYRDLNKWSKMSLTNIAHSGVFSSDNTVKKYADEIWGIEPVNN